MGDEETRNKSLEDVNDERKHLEGLLQSRINFHLVFAGIFMAGLSSINPVIRVWALGFITFISLAIFLAVFRTFLLVMKALHEIRKQAPEAPYPRYCRDLWWFPINANYSLLTIPIVLTAAFGAATFFYCHRYHGSPPDSKVGTVYQIEDNSDRRVVNGVEPGQKINQSRSSGLPNKH